jgi:paraquat-inducible protein A
MDADSAERVPIGQRPCANTRAESRPMQARQFLIVCEHCDAVFRKPPHARDGVLIRCTRCGAAMERMQRLRPASMLALALAALVVFAIANLYPIIDVRLYGASNASTLWGAIIATWNQGAGTAAVLAALTAFFFPLIELLTAAYVLWPLAGGRRPRAFGDAMRLLRFARDWSMTEVFMLAALVALVKLGGIAGLSVVPNVGLWALAALTVLVTLVVSFDHPRLWDIAAECAG